MCSNVIVHTNRQTHNDTTCETIALDDNIVSATKKLKTANGSVLVFVR